MRRDDVRRGRTTGILIAFVIGIVGSLVAVPGAHAENKIVDTTVVSLDGEPGDLAVDASRNRVYIPLRDEDQILEIDIATGKTVAEHFVSQPVGLDLSADGAYLYAALYGSTGIARIDLSDWTSTSVTLTELGDSRTWDVAEVAPDVVLVTANPGSNGISRVVRYDFAMSAQSIVASNRIIRAGPRIVVDDAGSYAYIGEGFSPPSIYRLDLTSPDMEIVAEDAHGSVSGTQLLAIAPAGDFLVTSTGQKLRTSDLTQIGTFDFGGHVISPDGDNVYSLGEATAAGMTLSIADATTTQRIEQWDVDCPGDRYDNPRLAAVEGGNELIAASMSAVCIIHTETARLGPLPAGGRFFDDDGSVHEASIEAIAAAGITTGCNPPYSTGYCPDDVVTRGQMAAFLSRALDLPGGAVNTFVDDDDSEFEGDIARLAAARITFGCDPPANTRFCPTDPVTREQMAAFLVRAFDYRAAASDVFVDDDDSVFERDIDALAAAGVTLGCDPPSNTMYCPRSPVTRAQMATFLTRALDLHVRATTDRPATLTGTDLEIVPRAEAAGCTGLDGEVCRVSVNNVAGEFFLLTGWFTDHWSSLPQAVKNDFLSTGVRVEATFDGVPLRLVQWPLEVIDDNAEKLYSFQFPDWLSDVHTLEVTFIDRPNDNESTVRLTLNMADSQPGYLAAAPAPAGVSEPGRLGLVAFPAR
ncbi:MAG: hypothetical protein PVI35_02635 [Acidimicrobiia bacterium]|jgi:hypothetical protein